jgi:hypothetical protein
MSILGVTENDHVYVYSMRREIFITKTVLNSILFFLFLNPYFSEGKREEEIVTRFESSKNRTELGRVKKTDMEQSLKKFDAVKKIKKYSVL